jgi:hypothetical protein
LDDVSKKNSVEWENTMTFTRNQKRAAIVGLLAVTVTSIVLVGILTLRQGSMTTLQLENSVTPVDVSDEDLTCHMKKSATARTSAKGDVNMARFLWFTRWWKQGLVVHCPRTTGTPHDLKDDEATRYLHGYLDLKKRFLDDIAAAKKHWKEFGYKEGRIIPNVPLSIDNTIISLSSGASKKYCGTAERTHEVTCTKTSVTDTERYRVETVGPNLIALKGYASNKYASHNTERGLICDKATVAEAAKFEYKQVGRSGLILRLRGQYCGNKGGRVICKTFNPDIDSLFTWSQQVPTSEMTFASMKSSSTGTIQPSSAATSTTAVTQTLTKEQERHNNAFAECVRTRSEAECAILMGPPVTQTTASTFVTQSAASTTAKQTLTKEEQERHNNAFAECVGTRSEAECAILMGPPVTQATASTFVTQSAASTTAKQTLTKEEQERHNNAFAECVGTRSEAECVNLMGPSAMLDAAKKAEKAANAAKAAVEKSSGTLGSLTDRFKQTTSSGSVDKWVETTVTVANAVAEVAKNVATNTAAVEKETVQKTTEAVATNNNALDTNAKAIGDTVNVVQATNNAVLETKDIEGAKNNVKAASDTAIAATDNAEAAGKNAKSAAENATTAKTEGTAAEAEAAAKVAKDAEQLALEAKEKADAATKASQDAQKVNEVVSKEVIKANSETVWKPNSTNGISYAEEARAKEIMEEARAKAKALLEEAKAKALMESDTTVDDTSTSKTVVVHQNDNDSTMLLLLLGGIGLSYFVYYKWKRRTA